MVPQISYCRICYQKTVILKNLKKAQELGYAEAEPSFDIDGIDTAHKLSILASIAFNVNCGVNKISVDGIRNIELIDLKNILKNLDIK